MVPFLNLLTTAIPNICSKELIDFMKEYIKDFSESPQKQEELQSDINILIAQQNTYPQTSEKTSKQSCFLDL
jgi:hypothetical protein